MLVDATTKGDFLAGRVSYQLAHWDQHSFTTVITATACTATSFSSDATIININASNALAIQVTIAN